MPRVLLIEDDPTLAQAMTAHLRHAGFSTDVAADGLLGLRLLRHLRPDIAIVDLMLPGLDGWSIMQQARADRMDVPIIAISARSAEEDRVQTLETGADDYLTKPFSMRELVARVEAHLRRTRLLAERPAIDGEVAVDGLRIDGNLRRVFVQTADDQPTEQWEDAGLTPTEYRLVAALTQEPGVARTRDELQRRVWGTPYRHRDRTVDVCIRKIRAKIDRRSPDHAYFHTHYGVGYRFSAEPKGESTSF